MATSDIPNLVKHCTIAIWRDGKISGGKQERFISAWNIARARLVEYGFLTKGSENGTSEQIHLTSKGTKRESFHTREPGGKTKSMLFDQMFRWVEVAEDTKKGDGPSREETMAGDAPNIRRTEPFVNKPKKPESPIGTKLATALKKKKDKEEEKKSKLGGPFKPVPQLGQKKKK